MTKSKPTIVQSQKTGAESLKQRATDRKSNRPTSAAILAELKRRLSEIYDLNAAKSVLTWDEATYMPKGGAAARGRQAAQVPSGS